MHQIPLFPLQAVLFPHGRMPLQIFEPRYLDLIKDSLKNNRGFGVIWLRDGREVVGVKASPKVRLAEIGTFAEIVDWHSLDNGLLGVVIEGRRKFTINSAVQQADGLWRAEVDWIAEEPFIALSPESEELMVLLRQLLRHPQIAQLGMPEECEDVDSLTCMLCQLLPIDEATKYALLSAMDPLTRLEELMDLLASLE